MNIINSKDNKNIKDIKKLKDKKYRDKLNLFIVEGFRFAEEAFKAREDILYVAIDEREEERFNESPIKTYLNKDSSVLLVSSGIFKELCDTQTPQGILLVVRRKKDIENYQKGLYVLADRIQDPGNLGTIIRTAHAVGACGVIITKGTVDPYNLKTLRSTMGSIFHVNIIEEDSDLTVTKSLKEQGHILIAAALKAKADFYELSLNRDLILAVGNEGEGLSKEIMDLSDVSFRIPMPGGTESLNAAVSCAVVLYEIIRQKSIFWRISNANFFK